MDASYKFYRTTFSKVTLHKTKGTSTRGLQKININVTLVSSVGPVEANLDTKEHTTNLDTKERTTNLDTKERTTDLDTKECTTNLDTKERTTTSLVPRPSHHPGFDCLQHAKKAGGRPGIFYHVNDVSVYLGRQRGRGVPHRKNELEAISYSFCPKHWSFERL